MLLTGLIFAFISDISMKIGANSEKKDEK